mgnify:CR=1 FL=1
MHVCIYSHLSLAVLYVCAMYVYLYLPVYLFRSELFREKGLHVCMCVCAVYMDSSGVEYVCTYTYIRIYICTLVVLKIMCVYLYIC